MFTRIGLEISKRQEIYGCDNLGATLLDYGELNRGSSDQIAMHYHIAMMSVSGLPKVKFGARGTHGRQSRKLEAHLFGAKRNI